MQCSFGVHFPACCVSLPKCNLQGFKHPKFCRLLSINSMTKENWIDHPPLDIQSYLVRFGVWLVRYVFGDQILNLSFGGTGCLGPVILGGFSGRKPDRSGPLGSLHWWVIVFNDLNWLVVEPTHLKNMNVKMDKFPKVRVENTKNIWVATT